MMLSLLLAVAAPPFTLAGMSLGSPIGSVATEHRDLKKYPNRGGWMWTWKRPKGGTIDVYTDAIGAITAITFTADEGENGDVDLPCAGSFDIQGSHVNLQFAIDPKVCVLNGLSTYVLPDQSVLDVDFDGPGDGQLHQATWYRPAPQPSPAATGQNRRSHFLDNAPRAAVPQ